MIQNLYSGPYGVTFNTFQNFKNSNLAANTMAKCLCNTDVNKIAVLVFNSDSEEEFMLNDYDFEYT
jgi:hypothetical protein